MREDAKTVDFYINQVPVAISLECPYCGIEVRINWDDIDVPEYWGDDWGEVTCSYCGKEINLGNYELD